MSVVFILASLHFLLSHKLFGSSLLSAILLFIPVIIGLSGIVYKQILLDQIIPKPKYKIVKSKKLNSDTIEIILNPINKPVPFTPGQYCFFSFYGPKLTRESHPFTLCGTHQESQISILVKAKGDFTKALYDQIDHVSYADLEGPYGRFDYRKAGESQVWIAGGVGIVPFVAWTRIISRLDVSPKIDLFYSVHRKQDAIHIEEFKQLSTLHPNFRFFLFISEENNRLSLSKIQEVTKGLKTSTILLCGPKRMTGDFSKKFQNLGISQDKIIFEDFEFI